MDKTNKSIQKFVDQTSKHFNSLPWEDKKFYANWLAQTYYFTRNVTRALAKAAAQCAHDQNDLHKAMIHGISEEKNHDAIALMDLKKLGYSILDFQENPSTTAYYSTLMHLIDTEGAEVLLGYSVILEGLAASGADDVLARLEKKHGKDTTKFVHLHVKVDKDHFTEAVEQISKLNEMQLKKTFRGIQCSHRLYGNMINEIHESFQAQTQQRLTNSKSA